MGLNSLRDKLLQAGVVTAEQVKKSEEAAQAAAAKAKAEKERERERREARGPGGGGHDRGGARGGDDRGGPRGGSDRGGARGGQDRGGPRGGGKPVAPRPLTAEEQRRREEEAAYREKERALSSERDANRQRAMEDQQRQKKLRELAEAHGVAERGDETFHFVTRKQRVQRLYLTPAQIAALEAGELAVIERPMPASIEFALVTRAAAELALAIDLRALRFFARASGETYGFVGDAGGASARAAEKGDSEAEVAEGEAAEEPAAAAETAEEPAAE